MTIPHLKESMKKVTDKDYTDEYFRLQVRRYKELDEWARTRIKNVLSTVKPSKRDIIADIGCGIGTFAIECAKRGSYVYAVDYSQVALDIAKGLRKEMGVDRITFINSSVDDIPIEDCKVNKAICADLVEHLYPKEFDALLKELHRIVKKDGYVYIYTPNPKNLVGLLPDPIKRLGMSIFIRSKLDNMNDEKTKEVEEYNQKFEYVHVDLKDAKYIKSKLIERNFKIEREIHKIMWLPALEEIPVVRNYMGNHILIIARKISSIVDAKRLG